MTTHIPPGAVVCGVDGSPGSDAALTKAAELAQLEHRPLHLMHAEPVPVVFTTSFYHRQLDDLPSLVHLAGEHVTGEAAARVERQFPDVEVTTSVRDTDPREALLTASRSASVVVVGSRGRGGVPHLPLGSVSLWVSQHSDCPTVVVRTGQAPSPKAPIVVGTDDTEASAPALEYAFVQASFQHRRLVVVHCFAEPFQGGYGLTGLPDEDLEGLPEERLFLAESIAGLREKYPDVEVTTEIHAGRAAEFLVGASENAALLVVGSRKRPRAAALFFGAVSRSVVEHARCTVAVVPPTS
jgi:nucleotide-binding universal stress UspA family protein